MNTNEPAALAARYDHTIVEAGRYAAWEHAGAFAADQHAPGDGHRAPFSMLLPPPNITGNLHMGHAYEHTMSDAAARFHRMNGSETMWLPGLDHAGIATQNIIERHLASEGLTRHDIGRDAFLERAWAQKNASAGSILDQMRQLGTSPDWSRLQFTLDTGPQQTVRTLFTRLFDDGLIYRAERPNPWCPRCTTALSDIELDTDDDGIERCSRCTTITELRTTPQWFLRTASLAALARNAYTSGEFEIQPADMGDAYLDWCNNMHDWCLSRQLWWGHRIPIWHSPDGSYAAFEHDDDIPDGWTQDDDILDTWFSSALWPLSTLGWPEHTADLDRYYPSTLLCTGYDLLFFWAIRMIMLSIYASGTAPFKTLHLHGMIRDAHGKKMSKSFGNTIDPSDTIADYGADALRLALAAKSHPGADLSFGNSDLEGASATLKKLWSIARFITEARARHATADHGSALGSESNTAGGATLNAALLHRLELCKEATGHAYEHMELARATAAIARFLMDDLSSSHVELIKPTLRAGGAAAGHALDTLEETIRTLLLLLHPIAPFITEELGERFGCDSPIDCISWPERNEQRHSPDADRAIRDLEAAVGAARSHKADLGLTQSARLPARVHTSTFENELRNAAHISGAGDKFAAAATLHFGDITLELPGAAALDADNRQRLQKQHDRLEQTAAQLAGRLADAQFLARAPRDAIVATRLRLESTTAQHAKLELLLQS